MHKLIVFQRAWRELIGSCREQEVADKERKVLQAGHLVPRDLPHVGRSRKAHCKSDCTRMICARPYGVPRAIPPAVSVCRNTRHRLINLIRGTLINVFFDAPKSGQAESRRRKKKQRETSVAI